MNIRMTLSHAPPKWYAKTFFYGSAEDITEEIIPFVKEGSELNLVSDLSPIMIQLHPIENANQMAKVCRLVKEAC